MNHQNIIPNCFYRVSVKALVLDDSREKFLVSLDNFKWEIPGGGVNHGESAHDALKREIKEEMGLEILEIAESPCYVTFAKREIDDNWAVNIFYETTLKDLNFVASDECAQIKFIRKNDVINLDCFPSVTEFIKHFNPNKHR